MDTVESTETATEKKTVTETEASIKTMTKALTGNKTEENTEEKMEEKTEIKTDEKTEIKTDEKTEEKTDEKTEETTEEKTEASSEAATETVPEETTEISVPPSSTPPSDSGPPSPSCPPSPRPPSMKREKSHSGSVEREKKRVKFEEAPDGSHPRGLAPTPPKRHKPGGALKRGEGLKGVRKGILKRPPDWGNPPLDPLSPTLPIAPSNPKPPQRSKPPTPPSPRPCKTARRGCDEQDPQKGGSAPRRKRTPVTPTTARGAPPILTLQERRVALSLKRKEGAESPLPPDAGGREPLRKCPKMAGEGAPPATQKTAKEPLTTEGKRLDHRGPSGTLSPCCPECRETKKALEELQSLKEQNRCLEEKIKENASRERDLSTLQRALKEQYEIQNSKVVRESKKEAAILLSKLKSKDQILANLENTLQKQGRDKNKRSQNLQTDSSTRNNSIPRPSLTRSVSAAASIGRRPRTPTNKTVKLSSKEPNPRPPLTTKKRGDLSGKGGGTERRYISKLEHLKAQIEQQQKQIRDLNDQLKSQNPNLKSLSQLSASVPTVYEGDSTDAPASRSTSSRPSYPGGIDTPKYESWVHTASTQLCLADQCLIRDKGSEAQSATMAHLNEGRCLSLDLYGGSYSSLEPPSSLRYSSLVSLSGNRKESDLTEENELLRAELQETRDHAELLEFRILEFTEGIQRATSGVHSTCDQSTNTSANDVISSPPISEDLSLPLSVDSGLELNVDLNKSRIQECRKALTRLQESSALESSSVAYLSSLLDCSFPGGHYDPPTALSPPRTPLQKRMGAPDRLLEEEDKEEVVLGEEEVVLEDAFCESDLAMLSSRLQQTLSNPKAQEEVLQETVAKLRSVNSSLNRLQSRVTSLTSENKDLQEALSALHESHETRTEASGTESELVNGKSPSLHSDLSDSESDDSSRPTKTSNLETVTSFQESGIFESSCEMVNEGTQTVIASDEYLVAALEGEKVTLCKIEYDTIVATERSLQQEIEVLRFEKEQLTNAVVQEKLEKASKDDKSEVWKAHVRLLEERLEISDRLKKQYFEDKCEMEEAENDARLLAQRLESQLEAAREMESLLSASLSQEQEFCRELQRRVREMHEIDRGRRLHEEVLEKENRFCRRREEALLVANDSQKSQLTFALYGLILTQFWRRFASCNTKALVPFSPSEGLDTSGFRGGGTDPLLPSFPCNTECQRCLSGQYKATDCVSISDVGTQTPSSCLKRGDDVFEGMEELSVDAEEEVRERRVVTSLTTAADLSDREEFYLMQIEALQKERKTLREDYESEQSLLIEQLQTMKDDLKRFQQGLEESQRDKCKLLFKIEEMEAVMRGSEIDLERQAKELKRDFSQSVEVYQQEQKAMQDQYEERIVELRRNIEFHEQKFGALLQQYSILQHELEPYFHSVGESVDEYSEDGGSGGRILTTKDLLSAVRELVRSESSVKQKLNELEKKESAYRETINEADRIMSNHVTIYTRRIEELEAALEQKASRIKQLEMSEERLRTTMKSNWKSGEGARITELLDRLIETENSELNLKERVWNLERNGKELQIKFAEAEKAQENLRGELRDQEELVQRLMTLKSENNALTSQLQEAHEAARRASDIQQSENYLKNRVDELESSENGLREALKQMEQIMKQRERKFRDQLSNMDEEICSLRSQLEMRASESSQTKGVESSLRSQIENYKGQIMNLEKELKETSSENICHETQHRSEVTKIRSQLKLANSQLTDFDTLNGELKLQLASAEAAMKEVAIQLEERARRHENEVLSLNLQLNQRDSRIEEFEVQLQQFSHSNVAGEFDFLATSPLVNLHNSLEVFIKNSQNCEACSKNQRSHLDHLNDCLKTLNELIHGRNSQSDSESEDFETTHAENLANESYSTTSPPTPAQEGHNDTSSGEGETSSVYSLTLSNDLSNDGAKLHPMVPPRPRRDAKKKKRTRKSVKQEGSLLDELEESTVEKGSFYGKCLPSVAILDELEEKVRELEKVVAIKDEELRLADGEANDLHSRLIEEDGKLLMKEEEANQSNEELISLRQQLLMTIQEYESVRQALEAKHQVDMSLLTKKVESLTEDLLRLTKKTHMKDKIIGTLVKQIRCILRSGTTTVLVNEIRKISEESISKEEEKQIIESDLEIVDFDVDTVCNVLEEPEEVSPDPEANQAHQVDAISYQSLPSLSSAESSKVTKKSRSASDTDSAKHSIGAPPKACLASRNLPPLEPTKKSRIPRFRPLSGTPLKHDDCPLQDFVPKPFNKTIKSLNSEGLRAKSSEAKPELRPLAKVVPKQRPMAKVTPKPKQSLEADDLSTKYLTDARKIKRMVTGLAPLNARVDCSSAPEFKKQSKPPAPSCVPRPMDLRITRRVGIDGAVIAWKPLEHDCVAGFQVIVGGRVVQQVRSPHRTKALVTGLPFPSPFTIGLVTVAEDGRCSTPTLVSHEKTNAYKPKLHQQKNSTASLTSPNMTPKRAVPTCL